MDENQENSAELRLTAITNGIQLDPRLLAQTLQLMPSTAKTYASDLKHFYGWLAERGLPITSLESHQQISKDVMLAYRQHLAESFAKGSAARRLTVARRLLAELKERGILASSPAEGVKGFKGLNTETTHRALTLLETKELLAAIETGTRLGKRDYALVMLAVRSGLRLSEISGLKLGDLRSEQGHSVAVIEHGKGDKRRIVKLAVPVKRAIDEYLAATGREAAPVTAPLFVAISQKDKVTAKPFINRQIQRMINQRAAAIGITDLSPHGLRATFITLSLEGGAKLQQVQYFAGHSDPKTTERYQKRKLNLDDSAADYVRL